jgi:SAM-dependent methyltransferase
MPAQVLHEPAYQSYLQALGDLRGKRVLECGCGDGSISVLLAAAGAQVHAFDISPASVALCRDRAVAWGVTDRLAVAAADLERLPYPDTAFDVVCGTFVLHHVDATIAGQNIARVVKPHGYAVFLENSAANPVLMLGRRRLVGHLGISRIGTPDEHPLRQSDIRCLQLAFGHVHRSFPQMVFFRLAFYRFVLAALPPERFPKGRLRHLGNLLWNLGLRIDDALYRFCPFLRPYSWWQVLVLSKPLPLGANTLFPSHRGPA